MGMANQTQAVDRAGHMHIGENRMDVGRSLMKYRQGRVRVFDFDDLEPGIAQGVHSDHADEQFIFDDDNRGGCIIHVVDKCQRNAGLRANVTVTEKKVRFVNVVTEMWNDLPAF
jgi:hypothetical protein